MADRNVKLLLTIVSSWDGKGARQAEQDTDKLGKSTLNLGKIATDGDNDGVGGVLWKTSVMYAEDGVGGQWGTWHFID